jgi:pyruvate,orthophosphate dikinase
MQVKAIFQAATERLREGFRPQPEIMIPFIGYAEELRRVRRLVEQTAERMSKEQGVEIPYLVGTMIELPRAALTADEIAGQADFFSFGTNDLTQTTLGYSRDDAEGTFLPVYLRDKLLSDNPFAVLDEQGVGQLIAMAVRKGRQINPSLKLGICGEHGGEKRSIAFCHKAELTYVSCSPYRVPVARLAAAQAALSSGNAVDADIW